MEEKSMHRSFAAMMIVSLLLCVAIATAAEKPKAATKGPALGMAEPGAKPYEDFDPKNFENSATIDNEWWPLKPGTEFVYDGFVVEAGEKIPHKLVINVTDLTKVIGGVRAAVVYEKDMTDGQMVECELAFFAQDKEGNVWHLGQYRETYDEKEFVGGRTFLVGHLDGAGAGIMMPARPQTGTPSYSQGYGPPPFNWTDRGRVHQMGQKVKVPFGSYDDVLVTEEFNSEEPGAYQFKFYARGVGNVRAGWGGKDQVQETLELVKMSVLEGEALKKVRDEAMALEKRAYIYGTTSPAEQIQPTQ
jgi:hypothetical protein